VDDEEVMKQKVLQKWGAGLAGLAMSGSVLAEYAYNLQAPASKLASDVYHLHNLIMLVCLGIFIVVFGAMFYSLFTHRKSRGHKAANFHENYRSDMDCRAVYHSDGHGVSRSQGGD
jgi:heme/copper-type cytochrome/quinol oxidase subunit 2